MTATVDPLPGKDWNAHAVAGDILNRAPVNAPIVAFWIGEDGKLRYAKAGTDGRSLSWFAIVLLEMAQRCYRDYL